MALVALVLFSGFHRGEEQEIAAAIGWMMVASGALGVMLSSVFRRLGYSATTAGRWKVTNYG